MAAETELKLRIDPSDTARIGHLPWLKGVRGQTIHLRNVYYDTPERALASQGVALRHRVIGRQWFVTVKTREASSGGLAVRGEWEYPCEPEVLDFSGVENRALQKRLEKLRPQLSAQFSTDFKRRLWLFEPHQDLAVEVAVDQGEIISGDARAPICEVELELKNGSPQALFELALDIAGRIPLLPENLSKADRGHRLTQGIADAPVSAAPSPISKSQAPSAAFVQLALACVDHLLANTRGIRRHDDPEYIHQARVAIRRLRALFKVFAPHLPADFIARHNPAWRHLAGLLGDARDRDVLVGETLTEIAKNFDGHDGIEKFIAYQMSQRDRARETARKVFLGREPGQLVLQFLADLGRLAETKNEKSLKAFARKRLAHRCRRIELDCKKISDWASQKASRDIDIESLHRLRIQFKRLRYASEFFAPLFKADLAADELEHLKTIQNTLGRINDMERALAIESAAPDAIRCELIEGWLIATQQALIASLPEKTRRYLGHRAPWT